MLTVLWISLEYHDFKVQIDRERASYIAERRTFLQNIVESTASYIHFEYVQSSEITRNEVRSRVQEAANIAEHVLEQFEPQTARPQLEAMIRETLRPIRFFSGRGYFFAINMDGTEELFADRPELEGQNLSYMVDDQGRQVVSEMIELAQTQGEGFYEYNWTKPGSNLNTHPKIAYIKYIPELNWIIGTGEYLEDVERDQQQKALEYLSMLTIEEDGYIFGGTYDGISLLGPMVGQNMIETQDVEGTYIVKELISLAQGGGGFLEYVVPPFPGFDPLPKLSYVTAIPEWGWYIGYGVYIDEINTQIDHLRTELHWQILSRIIIISLLTGLLVLRIILSSRRLQKHFSDDHEVFMNYFSQAALKGQPISIASLNMEEYKNIASQLNMMVEKKNQLDGELQHSLNEKAVLLREVHHRVKNNFQTVASLLSMQEYQCEDSATKQALITAHDRIFSMAVVHNLLYQKNDFSRINIQKYVSEIATNVQSSQTHGASNILMETDVEDFDISLERAIPLGLILNELITNSYKYAFTDRTSGTINIVIHSENESCHFFYKDDGQGISDKKTQDSQGLGLELIKILTSQLNGELNCISTDGYQCSLRFPLHEC